MRSERDRAALCWRSLVEGSRKPLPNQGQLKNKSSSLEVRKNAVLIFLDVNG
jgi:hypothetical protein